MQTTPDCAPPSRLGKHSPICDTPIERSEPSVMFGLHIAYYRRNKWVGKFLQDLHGQIDFVHPEHS